MRSFVKKLQGVRILFWIVMTIAAIIVLTLTIVRAYLSGGRQANTVEDDITQWCELVSDEDYV